MRKPRHAADDSGILASGVHARQGSRSLAWLRGATYVAPTRTLGRMVRYVPTVAILVVGRHGRPPSPVGTVYGVRSQSVQNGKERTRTTREEVSRYGTPTSRRPCKRRERGSRLQEPAPAPRDAARPDPDAREVVRYVPTVQQRWPHERPRRRVPPVGTVKNKSPVRTQRASGDARREE